MDRRKTGWTLFDAGCARPFEQRMRAGVATGSNLGDRLDHLKTARQKIRELLAFREPLLSSAIYETEPVGCEPGAKEFFNAVIEFGYEGEPIELLRERSEERRVGKEWM